MDPKQHHCYACRYGGGVDRRHAALARCLADIIHSHSGVKVFIEQEVPALTRVVNGQTEHARMDLVFNLNGSVTYLDASIVAPFSCNPSLVSAVSTKPGLMAKRVEHSTGIHTSIWSRSFLRQQAVLAHTPENSSGTSCETLTTSTSNQGHLVHHPERAPQCHLQTTAHSRRYVISCDHCHSQFIFSASCYHMQLTGTHTAFSVSSLPQPCHVALL